MQPHLIGASSSAAPQPASGLRETALECGFSGLADEQTLELFLARAMPRGAATMAQVLIARFGSFEGVLGAPLQSLRSLVGEAAVDLKLLHEVTRRSLACAVRKRSVITSWSALLDYVRHDMANRSRESFRVLFLDRRNQLIPDEVMNEGTVDHAPVYPREVLRRALELDASSIILVHNHPTWPFSIPLDHARDH